MELRPEPKYEAGDIVYSASFMDYFGTLEISVKQIVKPMLYNDLPQYKCWIYDYKTIERYNDESFQDKVLIERTKQFISGEENALKRRSLKEAIEFAISGGGSRNGLFGTGSAIESVLFESLDEAIQSAMSNNRSSLASLIIGHFDEVDEQSWNYRKR